MSTSVIPEQLVLNWHLTEACNYSCRYCYAVWKAQEGSRPRELIHDSNAVVRLLQELYRFFRPMNTANPLAGQLTWSSVRLNLAGGEPLLNEERLATVVRVAREIGFEVSLISNASRMTPHILTQLVPQLSWLGLSIDSVIRHTNQLIGRLDRRGKQLDVSALAQALHRVRQHQPGMQLKVNTVVNHYNQAEYLGDCMRMLSPDKWKILRVLPVVSDGLVVSERGFEDFVNRHAEFRSIMFVEDNEDMRESYLMIDPHGRFFQNSDRAPGEGYIYSQPILEVGAEAAIASLRFSVERFRSRYIVGRPVGVA